MFKVYLKYLVIYQLETAVCCSSWNEFCSKHWRCPNLQPEGTRIRSPLSLRRLVLHIVTVRVRTTLLVKGQFSVQGCRKAKYKTYSPLDDHWVILLTSNSFNFSRTHCSFDDQCVVSSTSNAFEPRNAKRALSVAVTKLKSDVIF